MGRGAIEGRVESGRLHRVFRGVFAVGHPAIGTRDFALAAVLACGDGSVVSHRTAAELLGLLDRAPRIVDVIAPRQAGRGIPGISRHHVARPTESEIAIRDGIPCTNPSRTLIDLAGLLGGPSLSGAVERAAVLNALDIGEVDEMLARGPRRGAPALRAILEDWRPPISEAMDERRLRSRLEARVLALTRANRLPAPECNRVVEANGKRLEVDFLWLAQRFVVEGDSHRFHGNRVAFETDRRRDRDLMLGGFRVLRITWAQITREPEPVVESIGRLLSESRPGAAGRSPHR
jgi:very-short-patch-repair endonuclease